MEGTFQLRLPEEASPYFFAFGQTVYQAADDQAGRADLLQARSRCARPTRPPEQILALRSGSWEQPKAARIVPKEKAAFAYRETVRRRVDPALVEWSGAGVFQCRVFPWPRTLHRIVIGYDVDLVRAGDDLELRLDLPEQAARLRGRFQRGCRRPKSGSRSTRPAEQSADGRRLCYRLVNPKQRPLRVRLHEPGAVMLAGSDAQTGRYFATRFRPGAARGGQPAGRSPQAVFLVDASLSARPQFPRVAETAPRRAGQQPRPDRAVRRAVLQRRGVLVAGAVRGQHAGERRGPDEVCRRAGAGRAPPTWAAHWPKPRRRRLARRPAAAAPRLVPAERRGGHLGRRPTGRSWPATLKRPAAGPLFAYNTGLAGTDGRLLAHLAAQSGGAVFSVVGEAEIARAADRPPLAPLAAGRRQNARREATCWWPAARSSSSPASNCSLVGRGDARSERRPRSCSRSSTRQGNADRCATKIDRVLASELAARAYGQVAVGQLEDLADGRPSRSPPPTPATSA